MLSLKYIIIMTLVINTSYTIIDFNKNSKLYNWRVLDDVVMGGKSYSTFRINSNGNAVFEGEVSLENNGGFSSLRHRFEKIDVSNYEKIRIRLKGDGKKYQFRAKSSRFNQYSYVYRFQTNGDWQTIEIELINLIPTFRGRKLNMPNFTSNVLEEIGFLIGNKKNEKFKLLIDKIELR